MTNYLLKVAQMFTEWHLRVFWRHHLLSKKYCGYSCGNFWKHLGYFLLKHLVTLLSNQAFWLFCWFKFLITRVRSIGRELKSQHRILHGLFIIFSFGKSPGMAHFIKTRFNWHNLRYLGNIGIRKQFKGFETMVSIRSIVH